MTELLDWKAHDVVGSLLEHFDAYKKTSNTGKKIKDFKADLSNGQIQKTSRHTTQIAIDVKRNFTNRLKGLLASYIRHLRDVYLKTIQDVVKQQDKDF